MQREGPALEVLLQRIAATPTEFLDEPRIGDRGVIQVAAVVRDLLATRSVPFQLADLAGFAGRDAKVDRNRLSIVLLMSWLLADESCVGELSSPNTLALLQDDAKQLAAYTNASKLIADAERREELARLALARHDLRPQGESLAQAQDRFVAISSLERARILRASQEAEERAREVREALARKAAEESADKWTRE
jgi:hypothetical protein